MLENNSVNNKKIDTEKIEYHIREILKALGDDPEREGLIDTPKRVAKMYEEVFEGMMHPPTAQAGIATAVRPTVRVRIAIM